MYEDLLHYVWKYQRFNRNLITSGGTPVNVEFPGINNVDAGPDFTNAKIRIDNTLWAGNVEIHVKSSDWYTHNHHKDGAYKNIILHVVYEDDKDIFDRAGNKIPTVEIKDFIDNSLVSRYKSFTESKNPIACAKLINAVDTIVVFGWLEKLAIERLQNKTEDIFNKLALYKNDWEQAFYEIFARNLGFKVNAEPFEMLAKSVPQQYFAKCKNNLFQLEALLFGQAGLLEEKFTDEYPNSLKAEYSYLQKKFNLKPLNKHLWKFLRIRPGNFPTIRLAQFAGLIYKSENLFSKVIECNSAKELYSLFDAECSIYWFNHYVFDKETGEKSKKIGKSAIELLIINTMVPFLFTYGKAHESYKYIERSLEFLAQIPPESNHIIKTFSDTGIKAENAMQSQALIQCYNQYCLKRKCLQCNVGNAVLKN